MALTTDDLEAIRQRATCFTPGIFGTSLTDPGPVAVVAMRRGVVFTETIGGIWPRVGEEWPICDAIAADCAAALGYQSREELQTALRIFGRDILDLLPTKGG